VVAAAAAAAAAAMRRVGKHEHPIPLH